ncbi:MAG: hypothetical protein IPL61_33500 [Myxococcales bacterium]|nr:hypothetical protein [Myxococcales bacterium]
MQPQAPPGPPATVEIELSFFFMMWVLYLVTPSISVNGLAQRRTWGTHTFSLPPGHYVFEAWYPYLFTSRTSVGGLALTLAPGGHYKLRYRPAWLVFLAGSLKLIGAAQLPPASVHQLP